ncbi:hypothetical protein [Mycobacterium angelicum]|uniref:Leucyl aminopeptidase n=1 Tax=Mycobacterium angelicum TaxID=470074 RepID=A0A1W9ZBP2_MYCAN|nr:hypothetical protein [Mycobacterium angelicum]MCV7199786.1 hypothetical protein [Mycobacterium angelicum]ORA10971.1 hypothetical protein BST12_26250 [Mycobacterium angelicum]
MNAEGRGADPSVLHGMDTLCSSYLELRPQDRVLILYSDELEAEDDQGLLEVLRARIHAGAADAELKPADYLDVCIPADRDVLLLVSRVSSPHRGKVLEHLESVPGRTRVFRLFNFSPELFRLALAVDRESLDSLNSSIIAAAKATRDIHVTNGFGTDLHIRPLEDGGWTNSCGYFGGQFPGILPPGEVNTYTPHVTGTFVADGALNSSFGFPGDPRLADHPVTLEITESTVTGASCADPLIAGILNNFFEVENADRVGEVGFGTNEGITEWVDFVSHINERHAGLHLGLGSPTQPKTKVGWSAPLHLDLILDDCSIWFDDALVFADGRWDRGALRSLNPDPAAVSELGDVLHVDAV